jgi:hypothetical protein
MPSSVTSVEIATITQPTTAADPQNTATKTSSQTVEQTLAGISQALAAFHQAAHPQRHERSVFTKIERILTSLTKLVEAFAKLKSAEPATPETSEAKDITDTPTKAEESPATSNVEVLQAPTVSVDEPVAAATQSNADSTTTGTDICVTSAEAPVTEVVSSDIAFDQAAIRLGGTLGKTGEFLWKPESEKDGNLAILLPSSLTGRIREVCILMPDGSRALQRGNYAGVGNGSREHYRFSKPGKKFPDGAIVLIKLNDGSFRHLKITDTAKRITR